MSRGVSLTRCSLFSKFVSKKGIYFIFLFGSLNVSLKILFGLVSINSNDKGANSHSMFYSSQKYSEKIRNSIIFKNVLFHNVLSKWKNKRNEMLTQHPFFFHFMIYSDCNHEELYRLLHSIFAVDFGQRRVDLSIFSNCIQSFNQLDNIEWTHGRFHLIQSESDSNSNSNSKSNSSLTPLQYWTPESENEILFLLSSSSSILHPHFYHNLNDIILDMHRYSRNFFKKSMSSSSSSSLIQAEKSSDELYNNGNKNSLTLSKFGSVFDTLFGLSLNAFPSDRRSTLGIDAHESFLSQSVSDTCQLIFPKAWATFWAWHDAHSLDERTDDLELDALDFCSSCKYDIRNRLHTFLMENRIYNLHPNYDPSSFHICNPRSLIPQNEKDITKKRKNLEKSGYGHFRSALKVGQIMFSRHDSCGQKMKEGILATNVNDLKSMVDMIHVNRTIICTMVSPAFHQMLLNWMCYIKELNLHNAFFITHDEFQAHELVGMGLKVYLPDLDSSLGKGPHTSPLDYGSLKYKRFISARTHIIGLLLTFGYKILLADVDQVWLSNPFPHFQPSSGVDLFGQLDFDGNMGAGFLFLSPSPQMKNLWTKVDSMFTQHIRMLKNHPSRFNESLYASFLKSQENVHEQFYLLQLLQKSSNESKMDGKKESQTRNTKKERGVKEREKECASAVTFRALDALRFASGRDYFDFRRSILAGVTPVMIHNTYIIGRDKKVERFERFGMWRLHEKDNTCKCIQNVC